MLMPPKIVFMKMAIEKMITLMSKMKMEIISTRMMKEGADQK